VSFISKGKMQNDNAKCKKLSEGDVIVEGEHEREDSPQMVRQTHHRLTQILTDVRVTAGCLT
jgi:hypothetical protein